ncbi:hypothetical protein ASZ90_009112 [hydrocarbon metagenome]|uniref:Uncharacterized protein n=1 Tax=hydrocarbon metagenome TaxID=938273 RepID=A0A0W8FK52_9ZZZZ
MEGVRSYSITSGLRFTGGSAPGSDAGICVRLKTVVGCVHQLSWFLPTRHCTPLLSAVY